MVGKKASAFRSQDVPANPDIRNLDQAAEGSPRHQEVAGLSGCEGHRPRSPDCNAPYLAGGTVDPRRQIDSQERPARTVHALDREAGRSFQVAGQAGAEQGIDDQVRLVKKGIFGWGNLTLPVYCRLGGISRQAIDAPQETKAHAIASLGEDGGRDEAVAPI
jgi:hypothetical protein